MITVLIVEDEKLIRQGIKAIIQRSGVEVDTILECNNGELALEMLQNKKIDILLTDIHMPKMNGIELVKAIQQLEEKPFIVAISGYDDFSYAVELLRSGVKEYLLKPVNREQLKTVLEKLVIEIQSLHQKKEDDSSFYLSQLKRFLLEADMTEKERMEIFTQYDPLFVEGEYVLLCNCNGGRESVRHSEFIYISDVGAHEIFLVQTEFLEEIEVRYLRNSFVGRSKIHRGLVSFKEAFIEAKRARELAFLTERTVVEFEEAASMNEMEEKDILPLVQYMGTEKYSQSIKYFRTLLWEAKRKKTCIQLSYEVKEFLKGLEYNYEVAFGEDREEVAHLQEVLSYATISVFEQAFVKYLETFASRLQKDYEAYKNKQKIQQALLYIHEHFNEDINMAVVSNYISMNYSLFSLAFKQHTGHNFVNYLKSIRMKEAKRFLEETEYKIFEISNMVGYENEKHFMKSFKATYGVSPTEFRKNSNLK